MISRVVTLGGSNKDMTRQEEMDYYIGLNNQLARLTQLHDALASSIIERLLAGAEVEPGTHHASVVTEIVNGAKVHRLIVR